MKFPSISALISDIKQKINNLPAFLKVKGKELLELCQLKKIDIYIIKKFIGTYFFSIILIISIVIVIDTSEKMDAFYDHHAPLKAIIFNYYLNFIPYFVNLFSPLFTFIAVIFFTSKLAGNTEIIAILSSGVSFKRLMYPYFISATIIATMIFVLSGYIIPPANQVRLKFEDQYVKKFMSDNAHNVQLQVDQGVVAYIERFEEKGNAGCRFSLDKFKGKALVSRMTADSIIWKSGYRWTVKNYMIRDFKGLREEMRRGTKMDTTIMMHPADFFISFHEAPQMTNGALAGYISRQKSRGVGNTGAFSVEYYKRFANPLAAFILTLIGVSLSSRKVRGGVGFQIGVGIALSAIYILFSTVSATFAANGSMPAMLAVWLPNMVFMVIGVSLYIKARQ